MSVRRRRSHWPFYALAGAALLWSAVVRLTGGLSLEAVGIPVSSREPVRPLLVAAVCVVVAIALHVRAGLRPSPRTLASGAALGVAAAVLWLGLARGAFVAGGSDSYGYLSQARLWERGLPRFREPLASQVPWPDASHTFSPLGYGPNRGGVDIVPMYSPGYPMTMAAMRAVFGPGAEFWVVPLTAAGLLLCSYFLGARLWNPGVGLLATVLLATSPPFLYQALQPMSDVPAAFWWTLALALGLRARPVSLVAAGAATTVAVMTRPNLAPIGLLLTALLFVTQRGGSAPHGRRFPWLCVFAGTIGGALVVAVLNGVLYGSPFQTGYGSFDDLYSRENALPNLSRYLGWLVGTETPLIAAVLLSPVRFCESRLARWVSWYGLLLMIFAMASYVFWLVFETWTYLRFFLVMYPVMYLLLVSGTSVPRVTSGWLRWSVPVIVFAIVAFTHVKETQAGNVLPNAEFEQRYTLVGEYVARHLPRDAVVLSMQHSGSVRYYAERLTLRYDWLDPGWLDGATKFFEDKGVRCYCVLEEWEVSSFRDRFQATSALGRLDWEPLAVLSGVAVYELTPQR